MIRNSKGDFVDSVTVNGYYDDSVNCLINRNIKTLLWLMFDFDFVPWHIVCVRLFCDAVANFQTGQEEISLIATPLKLTVKNYVDDEPGWN